MSTEMTIDEFFDSKGSGATAILEPVPDKPKMVKVTPFWDDHGCGCGYSFEITRDSIRSVSPTGRYHFCHGRRLEVAVVEFAENASIPVADLMKRMARPDCNVQARPPYSSGTGHMSAQSAVGRGQGLVGRWHIPWTPCEITCIEVCTRFCAPTGWDCCQWETRCAINCNRAT